MDGDWRSRPPTGKPVSPLISDAFRRGNPIDHSYNFEIEAYVLGCPRNCPERQTVKSTVSEPRNSDKQACQGSEGQLTGVTCKTDLDCKGIGTGLCIAYPVTGDAWGNDDYVQGMTPFKIYNGQIIDWLDAPGFSKTPLGSVVYLEDLDFKSEVDGNPNYPAAKCLCHFLLREQWNGDKWDTGTDLKLLDDSVRCTKE